MTIAYLLYRGDSDPGGIRHLNAVRPVASRGYLLSNLSNSGSGNEIFIQTLISSINRHVHLGWKKTHFLSFSTSRDRAMTYASGEEKHELYPAYDEPWDAALMTLSTFSFQEIKREEGIYYCVYESSQRILGEKIQVLLIDVVAFIKNQISLGVPNLGEALRKSTTDAEWLILPLNPGENNASTELTSKLDATCISNFECFRFQEP